eukprot:9470902-Pyramimonas_sp.AAC.1
MTRRSASVFLLLFLKTHARRADPAAFWADAATLVSARPNQIIIVLKFQVPVIPNQSWVLGPKLNQSSSQT